MVEHFLTGLYVDQGGRILFANARFAEIYGYSREEIVGMNSIRLVHPSDMHVIDRMRVRRLKGRGAPSEYKARGITKNGDTIWVKRRNTKITVQRKPAILGNVVDITGQKDAEEELMEFLQAVSHDLKNPLLSDLRTLSQLGRVVPEVKEVSSLELVEKIASTLKPQLKEKQIDFQIVPDLPVIRCDEQTVRHVFENLIVNAAKYMREPEKPRIEIGYDDIGDFHRFYVRDNGMDIEPKFHKKIFEKFCWLRQTKNIAGTGLGLAIVTRIVDRHGGRVWVESEKGKGATFYFTLLKSPTYGTRQ